MSGSLVCGCTTPDPVSVGYAFRCEGCGKWITTMTDALRRWKARGSDQKHAPTGPFIPVLVPPAHKYDELTEELLSRLDPPARTRVGIYRRRGPEQVRIRIEQIRRQVAGLERELRALLETPPPRRDPRRIEP